jgi:hypothetical protein
VKPLHVEETPEEFRGYAVKSPTDLPLTYEQLKLGKLYLFFAEGSNPYLTSMTHTALSQMSVPF